MEKEPTAPGAVDLGAMADEKNDREQMAATAEQFSEEVFRDISGLSAGGVEVICPATVHLLSGPPIRAVNLNAIVMSSIGVFVVGIEGTKEKNEVSTLVPWDNIGRITYDRELMMKLVEKANS